MACAVYGGRIWRCERRPEINESGLAPADEHKPDSDYNGLAGRTGQRGFPRYWLSQR